MSITYEQAREDHEYLWSIGEACDMTGGYIDQQDLKTLLESPNKRTAAKCYCSQIDYWFQAGPDIKGGSAYDPESIPWDDILVQEIAERHGIDAPEVTP